MTGACAILQGIADQRPRILGGDRVDHLPKDRRISWNVSVMDPATQWQILTEAIIMGGHVRVGWEDNPYLGDGTLADTNALLVEKIVRIAREVGREVATPQETRQIIGIA